MDNKIFDMENNGQNMTKNKKIARILIIAGIVFAIIALGYLVLKLTGVLDLFDSAESLKELILSTGIWSRLVFVFVQFLQVTFLPVPAMVTTIAGTLIFGAFETFLLSIVAIMLGRLFAFWLGRKFGMPLVKWMVGQEDATKWSQVLGRGKYTYFLMLLFPLFPDDILCMIAGITTMSWKFYIVANAIAVVITNFAMCFFASGELIPFSGWGIPVWIVLGVLLVVAIFCSFKYQDKIEQVVYRLGEILGRKKDK